MLRNALLATVIQLFCAGLLVAETGALSTVAKEHNQDYRRLNLELELALLRVERQEIRARDTLERLEAEDSLLAARLTYRRGLEDFHHSLIASLYNVAVQNERLALSRLQSARAEERVRQEELRFERGLVPQSEVLQAVLALRSARRDHDNARWLLEDAEIHFRETAGQDWREALIPRVAPVESGSREQWILHDLALQRSELASRRARERQDRMPRNAAEFDRRIIAAEVEQAAFELERSRSEAERRFEQLSRRLQAQWETVLIRREETVLREELATESRRNFERGMITAAERDQIAEQVVQARIQALEAGRDYLITAVTYRTGLGPGETVEGLLR
jgi:outer membrane protein TolC